MFFIQKRFPITKHLAKPCLKSTYYSYNFLHKQFISVTANNKLYIRYLRFRPATPNVHPELAPNMVTKIVLMRFTWALSHAVQWHLLMLVAIKIAYIVKYISATPIMTSYLYKFKTNTGRTKILLVQMQTLFFHLFFICLSEKYHLLVEVTCKCTIFFIPGK